MEDASVSLLPLVVVTVLAFLVPLLVLHIPRITIPVVVGEIVAGIIVGRSGLGLVEEHVVLEVLAELGFVYLMFLAGLELNVSALSGRVQQHGAGARTLLSYPLVVGAATFGSSLLIAGGASVVLRELGLIQDVYIMALILSTTSLGVVVPVLKESGLSRRPFGQSILAAALFADFLTILLISVYALLKTGGWSGEVLLILALLAAFLTTYRIAALFQRRLPAERILEELSSATSQLKLRGSFALALIFVGLAESLGIENILGAFLAGVIISLLSEDHDSLLHEKQDAIGYGFLIPIFFIMVGAGFDLPALIESRRALALVPILLGVAYVVKVVPSLLFRFTYSWRETLAAGALLSSRLSLIIAASAIGLELGAITPAVNSGIILVAIITVTASPIAFSRILPETAEEQDRVIIVGSRPAGELLADRLRDRDIIVHLVGADMSADASQNGRPHALAALRQALDEVDAARARVLIAMSQDDEVNLRICRMARQFYRIDHVFAWVVDPATNGRYRQLGAQVVNPGYTTVMAMESMVLNPDVFERLPDLDADRGIRTVKLRNRAVIGRSVHEVNREHEASHILHLERGGQRLVPDDVSAPALILQANDLVTLAGDQDNIDDVARLFARETRRRV